MLVGRRFSVNRENMISAQWNFGQRSAKTIVSDEKGSFRMIDNVVDLPILQHVIDDDDNSAKRPHSKKSNNRFSGALQVNGNMVAPSYSPGLQYCRKSFGLMNQFCVGKPVLSIDECNVRCSVVALLKEKIG